MAMVTVMIDVTVQTETTRHIVAVAVLNKQQNSTAVRVDRHPNERKIRSIFQFE